MQLHNVQQKGRRKTKKRVGRGGTRGKTSGRGMKGQKAHSSGHIRPESRDIIKKLPKLRGYRFKSRQEKPVVVNVGMLEGTFKAGEDVTPKTLVSKGLVRRIKKGRIPHVKILGHGSLKKKLVLSGVVVSETARKHIEKAGGNISE